MVLGVGENVGVRVNVGVRDGVGVRVGVRVGVGVHVGVGVRVDVGVRVGVGVGVSVGTRVGVGVPSAELEETARVNVRSDVLKFVISIIYRVFWRGISPPEPITIVSSLAVSEYV